MTRLDLALVARGLARSRSQAAALIRQGRVQVDEVVITKPAWPVNPASQIKAENEIWVSRAAHKLLGALADSGLVVPERVLDAGASTGGFTQVLLSKGARQVYAVDVGHGQLAQQLRTDPRVVVREGLNLRDLSLSDLDDQSVQLIVGDVSFISLRLLLAPLFGVLANDGVALLLVKPQFEVGRERLGSRGIVRDAAGRSQAVHQVIDTAAELGFRPIWQGESRLIGEHGNREVFVAFTRGQVVS